jgi:hypothetical protein
MNLRAAAETLRQRNTRSHFHETLYAGVVKAWEASFSPSALRFARRRSRASHLGQLEDGDSLMIVLEMLASLTDSDDVQDDRSSALTYCGVKSR